MTAVLYTPSRIERAALGPAPRGLPVVRTGMGLRRTAATLAETAAAPMCAVAGVSAGAGGDEPMLMAGVAAGAAHLRAGELVVADEIRGPGARPGDPELSVPVPSAPLLAGALRQLGLSVHVGPVRSLRRLSHTGAHTGTDDPTEHRDATRVLALDMESAALAAHAQTRGAPFAVVRAIVDTPKHPLWRPGTPARGVRALRALRAAVPAFEQWAAATGTRQLRLAAPQSFCAGVSRAIDTVERALRRYGPPVYVRRQIVHNTHVVRQLEKLGAVFVEEVHDVPPGAVTVFAAHGVAPSVHQDAAARELEVIDATCPLVTKVHTEIRRYSRGGHTVFLIGHGDHEEVQGSVGEAPAEVIVVDTVEAAHRVRPRDPHRVAYTMQTTLAEDEAEEIASVLRTRFPAIAAPRSADVCYATTNRQRAVSAVAAESDLVLVVGSRNSSNSARLVEVATRAGAAAYLVDDAAEVELGWLAHASRIGITAGASAPPHLVTELVGCLAGLGPTDVIETALTTEDVKFALPKEVL